MVCVCVCVCMSGCGCGCVGECVRVCVCVWENLWVLCGSVHISLSLSSETIRPETMSRSNDHNSKNPNLEIKI